MTEQTNQTRIRVLIADDQALMRHALSGMLELELGITVVGQAEDGQRAVELANQLRPDVVLMDLKMPRMSGIAATRAITSAYPETQVIVLTTYDTDDLVFDAIRAGAHAYLLKDASEAELLEVIHAVHRGESRLDPNIARKVMNEFRRTSAPLRPPSEDDALAMEPLTEREAQILGLVAQGRTNKDIIAELHLTEGTVKNYVSKIMGKLHANDRTQLAVKALRSGMARLDG